MMKNIRLIIICLLISNIAVSQDTERSSGTKHEFSIYASGGISRLSYKFDAGTVSGGFGGGGGVGYTFNINPKFGIATGIGISMYGSKAASDGFSGQYATLDDGDELRFSYIIAPGYEETQTATLLTIPVMAQYSVPLGGGSTSFYAAGGLKLGLPISAKKLITSINTSSGHYSYEDQTYDNLPQHGFIREVGGSKMKSDIDLGFAAMLSLEAGVRFSLSGKTGLYAGLFFDYGLNSIQKSNDKHIVGYQSSSPSQLEYNSILNTEMVDKINLTSVGIKVKIAFGK
jgi:hypothetical protein